jgi:NAD-dependent SIR2 family protein deacetylase
MSDKKSCSIHGKIGDPDCQECKRILRNTVMEKGEKEGEHRKVKR